MIIGAKHSQSGFTIIEMAIVMVIIGLIVGFGASLIGPLSVRAKRIESTEIVEAGAAAIVGHAAANEGVLPTAAEFPGIANKRNDAWTRPIQYIYDAALADGNPATGDLCTRKNHTTHITPMFRCDLYGASNGFQRRIRHPERWRELQQPDRR